MCSDKFSCGTQECRTARRKADQPRRALDQSFTQPILQSLQLHADGGLRGVERLGRAREALEIGHQNKGLYRFNVQGRHIVYAKLLSLK